MKLLLLFRTPRSAFRIAANETVPAGQDEIGGVNETRAEGDWVVISPFGSFDNRVGMQRFEKPDAVAIVNEFNSMLKLPQRLLGLPWYIGHPDYPPMQDKYKDTRAYGRVKELSVRDDGLYGRVKWSDEGKKLIESEAFHGHSPHWRMRQEGKVWRPFHLKSVGFTNEPGIPVPPVLAANETQTQNDEMKKELLIQILGLAADASDEQIQQALTGLKTTAAANEAEVKRLTDEAAAIAGKVTKLETDLAAVNETAGKVTKLEADFANERTARIADLVNDGMTRGVITGADKSQWEKDFANEFDATAKKLREVKPALHTVSIMKNLGQRNSETRGRIAQMQDAVNEHMTKTGEKDYNRAWSACAKAKPELFGTPAKA